jgi:hypothetical protein
MTPEDLVSILAEPVLSANGILVASAGEWRLAGDGLWHFWQDPDSGNEVSPVIQVVNKNP